MISGVHLTPTIGEVVIPRKVGGREAWWKLFINHKLVEIHD